MIPSLGRIVHYVSVGGSDLDGEFAAILTGCEDSVPTENSPCSLIFFAPFHLPLHASGVRQDPNKSSRSWHFPEHVAQPGISRESVVPPVVARD